MACKAAIKGNQSVTQTEIQHLLEELMTLENPYTCPHGRPTMIRMSKTELEKKFKRIV
jgi:DNA mismatch repair protein MutL